MDQFRILVGFELKKLLRNRAVMITLTACAVLLFSISMLEYLVISPQDQFVYERESDIDGRALDERFIAEIVAEAQKAGGLKSVGADSRYYHVSRYLSRALGDYMNIDGITGNYQLGDVTAESVYRTRLEILDYLYDFFGLSDAEREWWKGEEEKVSKPLEWRTNAGISAMRVNSYTCLTMFCMLAGVCLSGVYAMERAGHTDALIYATKKGRGDLWLEKFVAGELFALLSGFALLLALQLPNIAYNGFHGASGAWQLLVPFSSYPFTAGKMLAVYLGLFVLACLCVGAFVMLLSLLTGNLAATAGMVFATIILDLFLTLPAKLRPLSQLRALSPIQIFNNSGMTDPRLVRVFGKFLTPLQVAAILYPAATLACVWAIRRLYRRQQVG